MAHEELKMQYEEDRKNYGFNAYKLWEFEDNIVSKWINCDSNGPRWFPEINYRRKEDSFQPEYFSGLNWREAERFVGKVMEFSDNNTKWYISILKHIKSEETIVHRFLSKKGGWIYCRTCPETFIDPHPTIKITFNGKDYHLPKPETERLEIGTYFWAFDSSEAGLIYDNYYNGETTLSNSYINNKCVHLTEARAKAWADFWNELHK